MTEMQNYTDETAQTTLSIKSMRDATVIMLGPTGGDDEHVLMLPTLALLAMIDRTSPEAMRGYLRERSDYLDSPHDHPGTPVAGNGPAAEHFDYLDAVPEADSPDDVDEQPETEQERQRREAVAAAAEIGKSWRELTSAWADVCEAFRRGAKAGDR